MGFLRTQDILDPYITSDADLLPEDQGSWLYQDGDTTTPETTSGGVDWTLSNCCQTYEIVFLCLMAGYLVIIYFLWNTMIMKPMKLIAVFVHGKIILFVA